MLELIILTMKSLYIENVQSVTLSFTLPPIITHQEIMFQGVTLEM